MLCAYAQALFRQHASGQLIHFFFFICKKAPALQRLDAPIELNQPRSKTAEEDQHANALDQQDVRRWRGHARGSCSQCACAGRHTLALDELKKQAHALGQPGAVDDVEQRRTSYTSWTRRTMLTYNHAHTFDEVDELDEEAQSFDPLYDVDEVDQQVHAQH